MQQYIQEPSSGCNQASQHSSQDEHVIYLKVPRSGFEISNAPKLGAKSESKQLKDIWQSKI